jgi:hypothetical protein
LIHGELVLLLDVSLNFSLFKNVRTSFWMRIFDGANGIKGFFKSSDNIFQISIHAITIILSSSKQFKKAIKIFIPFYIFLKCG